MKRKEVKRKKKTNSLLASIKEAQKEKDWGEVSCILDEATVDDKGDIPELKSIIPDLVLHHEWLIRASTVQFIGGFRLRTFIKLVEERLQDKNPVVISYALMAYYDLRGAKALPAIKEFCKAQDVGLRVTALTLLFIETCDEIAFNKLYKILKRKRCHIKHRCATMNIFDHYCDIKPQCKIAKLCIVKLYEDILLDIPKTYGVAKWMSKTLKKWKQSK